jgi:radical SAM-linked protein
MGGGHAMVIARMKFIKGEEVKYISHLDLQRAFQRALRRGEIDIAYSQGYNPHPKISFAMALSVGMTSEGEYVDVELKDWYDADELIIKINSVLPKGLQIKECIISDEKHPSLMSTIRMGLYKIKLYMQNTPNKLEIEERINEFLLQKEIKVNRTNKRGILVEKDIRQLIEAIIVAKVEKNNVYIELKIATGSQNNVKPELVIEKLFSFGDIPLLYDSLKIHRVDLFAQVEGELISPIKLFNQKSGRENM